MTSSFLRSTLISISAALIVAACGGGGGGSTTGSGVGGTGAVASGTVSAIGSVLVNGVKFSCVGANVANDDGTIDQGAGDNCVAANGRGLLQRGMQVTVTGSIDDNNTTGTATSVAIRSEVTGPIRAGSINKTENTFVVLGKTVKVDEDTLFDINDSNTTGTSGLDRISDGMVVEVHGLPDGSGAIQATRVEDKAGIGIGQGEVEIKGVVATVSAGTNSFTIGGITINIGTFTLPAVGGCVEIHGRLDSSNQITLTRPAKSDDDCNGFSSSSASKAEVEGVVNGFVSATDFKVGNQKVTTDGSTQYKGGIVGDIADGLKVEVEGPITNGVLLARKVVFKTSVKIRAVADADTTAGSLKVLGITIKTNSQTRIDGSPIAAGNVVEVRGYKSGAKTVTALRLRNRSGGGGGGGGGGGDSGGGGGGGGGSSEPELQGPVESKTPSTGFTILGVPVSVGGAQFRDVSATDFFDDSKTPLNTIVKVKGKRKQKTKAFSHQAKRRPTQRCLGRFSFGGSSARPPTRAAILARKSGNISKGWLRWKSQKYCPCC
jgi:hypothetical protein